jgi:hypothetical protein
VPRSSPRRCCSPQPLFRNEAGSKDEPSAFTTVRSDGNVRRECLDQLLVLGRRQFEHVPRVYVRHYKRTGVTALST